MAQDLWDTITAGQLDEAFTRLDELMESVHSPTESWRDGMLTGIFEEAVKRADFRAAFRVLARTTDNKLLQVRRQYLYDFFAADIDLSSAN
jgi:hypothetical protein